MDKFYIRDKITALSLFPIIECYVSITQRQRNNSFNVDPHIIS